MNDLVLNVKVESKSKKKELIQACRPTHTEINPVPPNLLSEQTEHGLVVQLHVNFSLSVVLMNRFRDKRIN